MAKLRLPAWRGSREHQTKTVLVGGMGRHLPPKPPHRIEA
jgi:hypothetical protein